MPEVLAIPFAPGVHQDIDPAILPAGALARAENCRVRHGSLARRGNMIAGGTQAAQYVRPDPTDFRAAGTAVDAPALGGYLSELGSAAGNQVLITNARAYQRKATGDAWIEGGRCSRALPTEAHWVAYDDTVQTSGGSTMGSGVGQVAAAALPGYTAVTYERVDPKIGTKQCCLVVYDQSGIVVVQFTAGEDGALGGRQNPRVLACGNYFLWFYQSSVTGMFYVRKFDPPLRALSEENGFASATATGQGYDAVAYNGGTEVLFAYFVQGPSRIVSSRRLVSTALTTPGSWPIVSGTGQTFNTSGDALISIYGDESMSQVWLAFVTIAGNEARAVGYNGTLTSQVSSFDLMSGLPDDFTTYAAPSVTSRSSGSAWVAWTTYRGFGAPAVTSYQTFVARLDLGGSAPTGRARIFHTHLASRLFAGTASSFQLWTHTDSGVTPSEFFGTAVSSYAWRNQRRYSLCTVAVALDASGEAAYAVLQPELTPDERASKHGMRGWLPEVAFRAGQQDENGNLSTTGFFPALVPIRTSSDTSHDSLAVVLYEWESWRPPTSTARRVLEHASGALVVGGDLQELPLDAASRNVPPLRTAEFLEIADACRGLPNGFQYAPAILSSTAADDPTASLVAGAVYQFLATFEQVDGRGRLHRSAVSNLVTTTAPDATTKFTLVMSAAALTERFTASPSHPVVMHVYATQGNGSVFYRVTPNAGAPLAWDVAYTDFNITWVFQGVVDADIPTSEILYVSDGVKPNRPAPAHRFAAVGNGRVILGGLFNPRMLEISKYERPNAPSEFTREDAFRTMLPERCTGLAFLDGSFVAFTRHGIYLVPGGSLPSDQGAPALGTPVKLPSTVGCIDWRSILETPDGVMFQGERGIYLLPRGFGPPVLVSGPVQDELQGRTVVSACVVDDPGSDYGPGAGEVTPELERAPGQHLAVFSVFAPDWIGEKKGKLLVFDLDRRVWVSLDDSGANDYFGAAVANWNGRLAVASRVQIANDVRVEFPGPSSAGAVLTTGEIYPAGLFGRTAASKVQLMVTVLDPLCRVLLEVARDGDDFRPARPLPLTDLKVGQRTVLEWSMPPGREGRCIRLRFSEESDDPSLGVIFHGCAIEHTPAGGLPRTTTARRAA